jgi:endonuclease YncB( thermonuclease family)
VLRSDADSERRQPRLGLALFLCLLITACAPREAATACIADTAGLQQHRVEYVVDGDTLHLAGGEKLRLVGVNTPELGRDGRPDEPLASAARRALEAEVVAVAGLVWLQDAEEQRDRHGRLLAYAFNRDGESISARLIRQGLGFHVAISPNVAWAGCLAQAEQAARSSGLGIWSEPEYRALSAAELHRSQRGFVRIRDEVTHVSFKDNGWWLQLGGKVGVRIGRSNQQLFSRKELRQLDGRLVEVRGWLVPRDGDWWMISLGHSSMLRPDP